MMNRASTPEALDVVYHYALRLTNSHVYSASLNLIRKT